MVTIKTFVDKETGTLTHLVYDKKTKDAIVFDPVLDLDTIGWRTHKNSLYTLDGFISEQQLKLHYVLDTHIHADHLSGMQHLKNKYNAPLVINAAITLVQETFKEVFNFDEDFDNDDKYMALNCSRNISVNRCLRIIKAALFFPFWVIFSGLYFS